jgi:hypothetical protein
MLYGITAQSSLAQGVTTGRPAVRFDNSSVSAGLTKTLSIADSPLLTISMWVKVNDLSSQWQIISFEDFNTYYGVAVLYASDICGVFNDSTFSKYFQIGSNNGVVSAGAWNHFFASVDLNHGAGAKLGNLLWNGADVKYAPSTQDTNAAFNIPFNGKPFGIPANSAGLGAGSIISYCDVWIAPGVYLATTDVTKFRTVGGAPVDLGANGQIPTGTAPAYFFTGDATTFATNMGTGGAVTQVGSMTSVSGPP